MVVNRKKEQELADLYSAGFWMMVALTCILVYFGLEKRFYLATEGAVLTAFLALRLNSVLHQHRTLNWIRDELNGTH